MKKIYSIIILAVVVFMTAPALRAQMNSSVVTDKYVEGPGSDGNYTLTLETYVTGKIGQEAIEVPADIIIAMDYSGSMKKTGGYDYPTFNAAVTKKVTANGVKKTTTKNSSSSYWTYSNIEYGNSSGTADYQWSYLDADGTYYPVRRAKNLARANGTTKDVRALWIVKNGVKWYLRADGSLSETYDYANTSDTKALFKGTLYKGWRYKHTKDDGSLNNDSPYWGINYGGTAGQSNNQWYYKHTDGQYYPVRRSATLARADGTTMDVRAIWVVIDGQTKYLTPSGLADDYDKTVTKDGISLYFGTLYKGWTDATITAVATDYGVAGADGGYYYKHTDGVNYPVKKEQLADANTKYQSYVMIDGTKYYLYGDSISTEPFPYAKGTKMSIYFGNLYTVKTVKAFTKYEGLKRAVTGFIDALYNHSVEKGGLQHRLALLAWGSGLWYTHSAIQGLKGDTVAHDGSGDNTSYYYYNGSKNDKNLIRYKVTYPNLKEYTASGKSAQSVRVLKDFRNIMNDTQRAELKAEFNEQPTKWMLSSDPRWGMRLATILFDREGRKNGKNYNDVNRIESFEKSLLGGTAADNYWGNESAGIPARPKILILVSDGQFNGFNKSNYMSGEGDTWYAASHATSKSEINKAIEYANTLKGKGVTIYDIHVNTKAVNNNEIAIASGRDYVLTATNYTDELLNAMLSIVQDIDGASINLGSTSIVQDIVKSEFSVPGGSSTDNIEVYTSNCTGVQEGSGGSGDGDEGGEGGTVTGSGQLIFDDDHMESFPGIVTKTVNADGTTNIQVTNFDFSANWCGKRADNSYSGKKLIIKIPITVNEDLVGGKVYTNTTESVVIDGDGNVVQDYPRPQIGPFPVHIQIAKQGLLKDDSAVFAIYRKPVEVEEEGSGSGSGDDDEGDEGSGGGSDGGSSEPIPDPVYEPTPFMTVILSGKADGSEVTADIVGLDPGYYYKVVETHWSWRYDVDVRERSTETQTINPFRFVNTLKDDVSVKNGEDVKYNEFL